MAPELTVVADLDFSVDVPGRRPVHGRLAGAGRRLRLVVDDPTAFVGRGDSAGIRSFAAALARQDHGHRGQRRDRAAQPGLGALLVVAAPDDRLPAHAGRGGRGAWTRAGRAAARRRERGCCRTGRWRRRRTLLPLAPTFRRRPRQVTTTHAAYGGGDPRLILAPREDPWPGDRQPVFRLRRDVVTIGSDERCNVCLPGLQPLHAEAPRPGRRVLGGRPRRRHPGQRGAGRPRCCARPRGSGWDPGR